MSLLEVTPLLFVPLVMHWSIGLGPMLIMHPEFITNRLVLLVPRPLKLLMLDILSLEVRLEAMLLLLGLSFVEME